MAIATLVILTGNLAEAALAVTDDADLVHQFGRVDARFSEHMTRVAHDRLADNGWRITSRWDVQRDSSAAIWTADVADGRVH